MISPVHNKRARFLRKVTGSTDLERTMLKAIKALSFYGIPHLIAGGLAVQEQGYPRFTVDVDIIVPDVKDAREKLSISGFAENPGSSMTLTDRTTKVTIDLLPGGGKLSLGTTVPLPMPTTVSIEPQIIPLDTLINVKLSANRLKDLADVAELIKNNSLRRDFVVAGAVKLRYEEVWDKAAAESAAEGLIGKD